jgi:hypothetical protein
MTIALEKKEITTPKLPDITSIIAEVVNGFASGLIEVYGDDHWLADQAKSLTKAWLEVELERSMKLYYKNRYHN